MQSVLTVRTHTGKGHKESFGGDGCVYYFVLMVSQVCACIQTHSNVYIKYVQILYSIAQ